MANSQQSQPEPSEQEQQRAVQLYMAMLSAHEFGLSMQRQLDAMNALTEEQKLFFTRVERRRKGSLRK